MCSHTCYTNHWFLQNSDSFFARWFLDGMYLKWETQTSSAAAEWWLFNRHCYQLNKFNVYAHMKYESRSTTETIGKRSERASERARNWTRFSTKGLYYIWSNEHNFVLVFGFRQVGIVCAVVRCTTSQSAYYINRKGRRTCIYMHIIYILHSHRAYRKLETFETICFHRQQLCFASGFRRDFHWTHALTQQQQSPIEFAINLRASIYLKAAIKHCICAGEVVFPRN